MVFVFIKNKYRWLAGLLLLALPLTPASGFAQQEEDENQSPVSVEVHVAPAKATIGDLITYSIRVRHDANIEPFPPKFEPPEGLEPVDRGTRKLPSIKNQKVHEFWFRLRADRVGRYDFPSIALSFEATRDGKESEKIPGQIAIPKAELKIESILHLQGKPTDIRDIKPLEAIEKSWLPWILGILAILLVIALVIIYIRRKNGRPKASSPVLSENISPRELALRELEALKSKNLLGKGLVREYYFELSEIFRRYLGARYEFPALDWTTEEIKSHFMMAPEIEIRLQAKISEILELTDLVKFAKASVTPSENMREEIIRFIQASSKGEATDPTLVKNAPGDS
jgi:hypothetical protein